MCKKSKTTWASQKVKRITRIDGSPIGWVLLLTSHRHLVRAPKQIVKHPEVEIFLTQVIYHHNSCKITVANLCYRSCLEFRNDHDNLYLSPQKGFYQNEDLE